MKSKLFKSAFPSITLFLAVVVGATCSTRAQEQTKLHHHYQLIDLGTFGGPQSYFNALDLTDVFVFPTVFYNIAQVRNPRGVFLGFADTSTPDPYPSFCYNMCRIALSHTPSNGETAIGSTWGRFLVALAVRPSGSTRTD